MNNLFIIFILIVVNIYCKEYTYFQIPPPNVDPTFCNRKSKNSFICNPDKIISDDMADNFDKVADKLILKGPNVMCWIDMRNVTNKDGYNDPLNFAKNLAIEWLNFEYNFDILTIVSINDKYLDIIIYNKYNKILTTNLDKSFLNLKDRLQYEIINGQYDQAVQEYIDYINNSNIGFILFYTMLGIFIAIILILILPPIFGFSCVLIYVCIYCPITRLIKFIKSLK